MYCSSWISGSAVFLDASASDEEEEAISSSCYIQNEWAFWVEDIKAEGDDSEPSGPRSVCVMFEHELKQILPLHQHSCCVIIDRAGNGFVWFPRRHTGPLLLSDAVHVDCLVKLPAIPNAGFTHIIDAKGSVFAMQHSSRLYVSLWHVNSLWKPVYLEDVKERGVRISPNKGWVAVCSRRDLRDTVSVYAVAASELLKTPAAPQRQTQVSLISRWSVPRLSRRNPCGDIQKMHWMDGSTEDAFISLMDTSLFDAVYIYRALDGALVRCISADNQLNSYTISSEGSEEAPINKYDKELDALGVSAVAFHSGLIAVADHAQLIRLYSEPNLYMRPMSVLSHPSNFFAPVKMSSDDVLLFKEYTTKLDSVDTSAFEATRLEPGQRLKLPIAHESHGEEPMLTPFRFLSFSFDGKLLAAVTAQCPTIVWLWDVAAPANARLHSMIQLKWPISSLMWSPRVSSLAFASNTKNVFLWEQRGCAAALVPGGSSRPGKIMWDKTGTSLLVSTIKSNAAEGESPMFSFCTLSD